MTLRPRLFEFVPDAIARAFVSDDGEEPHRPTASWDQRYGGATLDEVGEALGLTRERARQLEEVALEKLRIACELEELLGGHAHAALIALRGRGVSTFRAALARARGDAGRW